MADPSVPDVGTGATITLSGAPALEWTSINVGEKSIDAVDTTHLGTTGVKTSMAGDLINQTPIVLDFIWNNELTPTVSTTSESLVITWPTHLLNTTSAANYTGTGFISKVVYPTMGVEELQTGQMEFTPDGLTDFVYTVGV